MSSVSLTGRRLAILGLLIAAPAAADPRYPPYPSAVEHALSIAIAADDPRAVAAIVGANPQFAAQIVTVAVTAHPNEASAIAAYASEAAPQVASEIDHAAAIAGPQPAPVAAPAIPAKAAPPAPVTPPLKATAKPQ